MQEEGKQLSPKVANVLLMLLLLLLLSLLSWTLNCSTSCKSAKENCLQVTQQVGLVKIPLGIDLQAFQHSVSQSMSLLFSSFSSALIIITSSPLLTLHLPSEVITISEVL